MYSESPFPSLDSSVVDIDWYQLSQLSEGNSEFELELLQMFTEDVPIYIEEIKTALANQDLVTLNRVAHQIKGSSGNVGAKKIESLAAELEKVSLDNSSELIREIILKLAEQLEVIKQLMNQKYVNG
ncbi:Hpt domain-containing protein [Merismopedia glauca]|uniref:Hpt domain-containing protein n=1 Tax=Merismopedia glauca CCAP 1448/3 TaxID=1296344 RepID=A0A2T1C3C5_9CYAN|nr:Hpt domain-containing protein [Merismopedia glauca]PSB02647.1 Hpt domain-containing protein [Merismopedia glauca CCAP 1448/3]